jgi:hypothetical protein
MTSPSSPSGGAPAGRVAEAAPADRVVTPKPGGQALNRPNHVDALPER